MVKQPYVTSITVVLKERFQSRLKFFYASSDFYGVRAILTVFVNINVFSGAFVAFVNFYFSLNQHEITFSYRFKETTLDLVASFCKKFCPDTEKQLTFE